MARKKGKPSGYYCVSTKRGERCMHKFLDGKVRFVKTGNVNCPKKCSH